MKRIAIVGAGLSGTLSAIYLLRKEIKTEIWHFEEAQLRWGRGRAYRATFTDHPLNVPAGQMSLFHDKPTHFFDWLQINYADKNYSPGDFLPRSVFGRYISEQLKESIRTSISAYHPVHTSIKSIEKGEKYILKCSATELPGFDFVIYAPGNFPPPDPPSMKPIKKNPSYFSNPWDIETAGLISPDDDVFILGTGLTAIDYLITFYNSRHKGKIILLSRNGRLPMVHDTAIAFNGNQNELMNHTKDPLLLFKIIKKLTKEKSMPELFGMADFIRNNAHTIWRNWNLQQKRIFLRHVRPYWEVIRHRIPPSSQNIIDSLKNNGKLTVYSGRLVSAKHQDDQISIDFTEKKSGNVKSINAKWIINATGPESNFRKINTSLVKSLINNGIVTTDPLELGLLADSKFHLISRNGEINLNFFTIGPPLKGVLWETSALREIREQALLISSEIMSSI